MRISSLIFGLSLVIAGPNSVAQIETTGWMNGIYWNVDSVYHDINYEEPGVMTEKGGIGGIRTEIGFPLFNFAHVSLGGSYLDGRLFYDGATFSGTPVQTITGDYFRDVRTMVHFKHSSFLFSIGYAERYWYNDLIISYRRRTEYKYMPIRVTYFTGPYYYAFEYDSWIEGENVSHMSDTGGGRSDVKLKQKSGGGYGLEFGKIIGGGASGARIFVGYHKWDVDPSEIGNDGVDNLVEPKNNTQTYQAGVGFFF